MTGLTTKEFSCLLPESNIEISGRRLQAMRIPSAHIQLALVTVAAVLSAALLGYGCPWGP
jgi:hypothetical protein